MDGPALRTLEEAVALAHSLGGGGHKLLVADWRGVAELADAEALWEPRNLDAWLSSGVRLPFALVERLRLVHASPELLAVLGAEDLGTADALYREAVRRLAPDSAEGGLRAFCLGTAQPVYRALAAQGREVLRPVWLHPPSRRAPFAVTLLVDLGEGESTDDELRRSEARYRAIVEDHPDFIVRYRPDGVRTFVNHAYARFFGGAPEDFVGTSFFDLIAPEHRAPVREKLRRLAEREAVAFTDEHLSRRYDGVDRWTHWIDRAIHDADGNLLEIQSVGRDVTDRREAEDERLAMERRLARAQKMEAVGTLASGLAHDFNNTLTGILAFGHSARSRPADPELVGECLDGILEAAERAAEVTRSLLLMGRRELPRTEDCDLGAVVRSAGRLLRGATPRAIAVEIEVDPALPPLRADPGQLTQALLNLGLNARDAIEGEGRIDIRVGMGSAAGVEEVVLRVDDDGSGMDEGVRERLFEPFFTTKAEGEGSGLGLVMVYGCARAHGGRVEVESQPGKGSSFEIRFPLVRGRTEQAPAAPPAEGGSESLLVVDDEPTILLLAREVLEDAGYAVHTAGSLEEALRFGLDESDRIDLLVTDHLMPGGTGTDLIRRLRARRPDLPALVFTGGLAERAGTEADAVLEKPFSAEGLLGAVRAALDRRRQAG